MNKQIHHKVKACIKDHPNKTFSDLFDISLYNVKDSINLLGLKGTDFELLSSFMLLFADDIALFTTNPESLQNL